MRPKYFFSIVLIFLCYMGSLFAQEQSVPDSLMSIRLKDGNELRGRIIERTETTLILQTSNGLEVKIPQSSIVTIKPVQGRYQKGVFLRSDPNYSRLMVSPTGRPLRKGEGYFSDYYIFFPGISYGFTDHFSLMAGFSIIPGANFKDQLKYLAPRIGFQINESVALSAGALFMSFFDELGAGIAFGVATFGQQDKSLTTGFGFGYVREEGEDFHFAQKPIILLGGNIRLSNSIALVSENWFFPGAGLNLKQQPFAIAVRFFGDRMAVDAGAILMLEILEQGFPVPWLSFVYHFGK